MFDYTLAEIVKVLKSDRTPVLHTESLPVELLNILLEKTVLEGTAGGYDNLPVFTYIKDEQIKIVKGGFTVRFPTTDELVHLGLTPTLTDYVNINFEKYNILEYVHNLHTVKDLVSYLKGKGIPSYTSDIKKSLVNLLTKNQCSSLGCVEFKIFGSVKPILELKMYTGWIENFKFQLTRSFIEEIILLDKELADQQNFLIPNTFN